MFLQGLVLLRPAHPSRPAGSSRRCRPSSKGGPQHLGTRSVGLDGSVGFPVAGGGGRRSLRQCRSPT
eukprot:11491296-Alexandrium_andersonii.AAC.1